MKTRRSFMSAVVVSALAMMVALIGITLFLRWIYPELWQ